MELKEGYDILIRDYLAKKDIFGEEAESHIKNIKSTLLDVENTTITKLKEYLLEESIEKSYQWAYKNAQALFIAAYNIQQIPLNKLSPSKCKFGISLEDRLQINDEYRLHLVEP